MGLFLFGIFLLAFLNFSAWGQEKNILQREDPVVISGEKFPSLLGADTAYLGLFAFRDGRLAPIPFQIDEKLPNGEYVFTKGEKATQDPDPSFDANDELVFMLFDAGERAGTINLAGVEKAYEIEISEPGKEGKAWAYFCLFSKPAPRSPKDYVQLKYIADKDSYLIVARNYKYSSPQQAVYYDYLAIKKPDGSYTPDLVDRLKIRGKVWILFGTIKVPFYFDKLVHSRITAWKDGAVRVIKRGEGYLKVAVIKLEGRGYSVLYFYPNFFIYPMTIDLPLDLRKVLTSIDLYGATDFLPSAFGFHYYDAQNPYQEDVVLDGKMSLAEKNLKKDFDHDWHCNIADWGSFCHRIIFPAEWKNIKRCVYYVDDASRQDPPEDEPGVFSSGYQFKNFIQLKKGAQTYWMHYYFPENFHPGEEWRFLNILDHPLKIKVQKIK